jgi:type IV pilus assembly protein PilW
MHLAILRLSPMFHVFRELQTMRRQQGLSLVELMIAIALSLVLILGVVQVFLSSRTVFSTQSGLSRIQETGRLGIEFIARDIRMVGFLGCWDRKLGTIVNYLNTPTAFNYRMDTGVEGFEANPAALTPAPLANTDILTVRIANGNIATASANNTAGQVLVTNTGTVANACGATASSSGICQNDLIVISNCLKATVFQATSLATSGTDVLINHVAAGTPGNATASWSADIYGAGSEVLTMNTITYFVATSPTTNQPALYQNINGTSLELLEGVENLQLTYSRQSTPTVYATAPTIAAQAGGWASPTNPVVSVRMELLVRSADDNLVDESQIYTFNGASVTAPDRRLRQVFRSTVGIRSILP